MTLRASLLILLLCSNNFAVAQNKELQLVGQAHLKVLFWSVYNSSLYSPDGDYQVGERPLRLEIEYLMNIAAEDLVKSTADEWRAQQRLHQRQNQWLQSLADIWPDVSSNDVITLELGADNRSVFFRNGEMLGSIDDPLFGQHFLDIWLSPDTTRPKLRRQLLGQR